MKKEWMNEWMNEWRIEIKKDKITKNILRINKWNKEM